MGVKKTTGVGKSCQRLDNSDVETALTSSGDEVCVEITGDEVKVSHRERGASCTLPRTRNKTLSTKRDASAEPLRAGAISPDFMQASCYDSISRKLSDVNTKETYI